MKPLSKKSISINFKLVAFILISPLFVFSQPLTITTNTVASTLAQTIVGAGVSVGNASLNCGVHASGTFTDPGPDLGLSNGIILTTGYATDAGGPAVFANYNENTHGVPTYADPYLTAIGGPAAIYDVCILTFTFVPVCNTVKIQYVFGSEEYPKYINHYNDAFGIFLDGPNPSGGNYAGTNIATLPNGHNTPVSIDSVNGGYTAADGATTGANAPIPASNSSYYVHNFTYAGTYTVAGNGEISYHGYTIPITSTAAVTPCQTYTMEIAIADGGNGNFDSGVFIQGSSVNCPGPVVTATASSTLNYCVNTGNVTAGLTNASPVSYTWSANAGSAHTSTVNNLSPGTYTCAMTYTLGCGTSYTLSATTTINPQTPLTVNTPTVTNVNCFGASTGSAVVSASGGTPSYNYSWAPSGGSSGTASNLAAGVYTVTVSDSHTCTATQTVTITQPASLTITSISSSPAACGNGGSATANVSGGTGPYTYAWSPSGGSAATASNLPGNIHYTVTVNDANLCGPVKDTVTITLANNIVVNATPSNAAPCVNDSVTLTATGATTYTWTAGAGTLSSVNGSTVTAHPSGATTYTVVGQTGTCLSTYTFSVGVSPNPTVTVTASPSLSVCPNNTVSLSGNGASTYTWTGGISNGVPFTPSSSSQTYTVTGSNASGCKATKTVTVTVFAQPAINVLPATICTGGTATLTATGVTTYTWSTGSLHDTTIVSPHTNTNYTVTGTDGNGCITSNTVAVTIGTFTISAIPSFTAICKGSSNTLTASGASQYTWSPAANLSANTGSPVTATPTSTVPVTYTVVGASGVCTATATVSFVVNPLPVITPTASAPSVCQGGTVTLGAGGANTYTWTGGVTNGVPFTPSSTQTYSVTGTDMNGCSSNMASVTVSVTPNPTITVAASQTICAGNSVTFTVSGASTYTWTGALSGSSINVSPSSGVNTYTVQGTDANGCLSNVASTSLTVNPTATIIATSTAVCAGATATLMASGATSYTWSPATGLSTTSGSVVAASTASTTVYTVSGNSGPCPAIPATATVTINLPPTITATSATVCSGHSATITASGASNYTWTPGNSHAATLTIAPGSSTSYTVTGTSTAGCVGTTGAVTSVYVNPKPSASFVPDPTGGQAPVAITFSNTSTGTGTLSSHWNFGNGDTSHVTNPSETFNQSGSYGVLLVVTDGNGCKDTALTKIIVTDAPIVIIIPNIFTPNGDGINDVFAIKGVGISSINCKIYDRWGIFLYEWSDINGGWDGKNVSNGKEVTDGTYYFILNYSDIKSKSYSRQGYLQLIR